MDSRLRGVVVSAGIVGMFAVAAVVGAGCDGVSPFLSAQFANTIVAAGGGGTATGGSSTNPQADDPVGSSIQSVCDVQDTWRQISVVVANGSTQRVKFSMTFAASAGLGGFVCDEERQSYENAGYSPALVPGSGNTITIGCDTLTLLRGTELLTLEFSSEQTVIPTLPPAEGDADNLTPSVYQLVRRDNGSQFIPLPEVIVFGSDDQTFICVGGGSVGDVCTQRGFVYFSTVSNLAVGKPVEAQRIQGTLCNVGFGTAPEWRLDTTVGDAQFQSFHYAAGGTIVVTILDRSADDTTVFRNQAVWLVTDGDGNTIHFPEP